MLSADSKKIEFWINEINRFNATPGAGTTRVSLTEEDMANRNFIKKEMRDLGLDIREDAIGNIYGTYVGEDRTLTPVWTGSHIDTVLCGGKFDGMAGVVAGLEVIRLLRENHIRCKRDITVVAFTSEEPTGYGLSCLGSRALAGELSLDKAKELVDKNGYSLLENLNKAGLPIEKWEELPQKNNSVYAFLELHVEQNIHLEEEKKTIGIVTKICAPSTYRVRVTGIQNHAGGTDMYHRKDAFTAACEMSLALESIARACSSEYNTATIGVLRLTPGSINVIPGECFFTVDIRDCDMMTKKETIELFQRQFRTIADRRGVGLEIEEVNNEMPVSCDKEIGEYMQQVCREQQYSSMKLISGPYHDSIFVSRFTRVAMLFVPSRGGISHSPDEWTDYEDIAKGTNVLAQTIVYLANRDR